MRKVFRRICFAFDFVCFTLLGGILLGFVCDKFPAPIDIVSHVLALIVVGVINFHIVRMTGPKMISPFIRTIIGVIVALIYIPAIHETHGLKSGIWASAIWGLMFSVTTWAIIKFIGNIGKAVFRRKKLLRSEAETGKVPAWQAFGPIFLPAVYIMWAGMAAILYPVEEILFFWQH